jgi:hypothetical protein
MIASVVFPLERDKLDCYQLPVDIHINTGLSQPESRISFRLVRFISPRGGRMNLIEEIEFKVE